VTHYQTRLFDYVAPLTGEEKADVVDIDNDGDTDYLYTMDGILYIKRSHIKEPNIPRDMTMNISSLDPKEIPEAPNYFEEVVASPGQIEIDFSPAQKTQQAFRLEFFDRYLEWDSDHLDRNNPQESPKTIVDLVVTENQKNVET
jgi:hypothetical protein